MILFANGSADRIKAKINAISTLSNLLAELTLRTTWHVIQHVLHAVIARSVALDFHTNTLGPLERTC